MQNWITNHKDDKASNYWSEKVLLREYTPSMHKSLKFKMQLSYPANEIEIRLLLKYDKRRQNIFRLRAS